MEVLCTFGHCIPLAENVLLWWKAFWCIDNGNKRVRYVDRRGKKVILCLAAFFAQLCVAKFNKRTHTCQFLQMTFIDWHAC